MTDKYSNPFPMFSWVSRKFAKNLVAKIKTLSQTFTSMIFFIKVLTRKALLSYNSYWKYLLSSKIPKCNATQIFLAFFPSRKKKKYGMCFCTWHFLQFSSHLAQSGVGCLWPPPSTSTFTDNYTTTQAKGHTKLLRIPIQHTYLPSIEYGQCSALNIFLFKHSVLK